MDVSFQLELGPLSAPIRYAELAAAVGVETGERAPLGAVRDAVLALRRSKGMVLDDADHDTWSAGSFFTNPVLTAADAAQPSRRRTALPAARRPGEDLRGLADRARGLRQGVRRRPGEAVRQAHAGPHEPGDATAEDILRLARDVRKGVREHFGVTLEPEPVLVGCAL